MNQDNRSRHRAAGPAKTNAVFSFFQKKPRQQTVPRRRAEAPLVSRRAMLVTPAAGIAVVATTMAINTLTGEMPTVSMEMIEEPKVPRTIEPVGEGEWDALLSPGDAQGIQGDLDAKARAKAAAKRAKAEREQAAKEAKERASREARTRARRKTRQGILDTARTYFGGPYLYGGNNPKTGIDCSAYTKLVYSKHGLSLPRVSRDQYRHCIPVSDPLPGDLVFFGSPIHHVGIYVRPGLMYDAPHKGSVVGESPIFDEYTKYARHPGMR